MFKNISEKYFKIFQIISKKISKNVKIFQKNCNVFFGYAVEN